jgi:hypothetical protein
MVIGTEMDVAVAEKVMGLKVLPDPVNYRGFSVGCVGSDGHDLPKYSTEIGDAWKVVMKLREMYHFSLESRNYDDGCGEWFVTIAALTGELGRLVVGKTAEHAICLAALSSVGVEVEYTLVRSVH